MIWLTDEDKHLLSEMENEINKEILSENWRRFMEFTPIHSGSPQEESAIQFLKNKLEEYGLEPEILRYEAYISDPKWSKLEVLTPKKVEIQCTSYRQVGTTDQEGLEGDVIYIPPDEVGESECQDKIVLADQRTAGDWMGLRDGLLLRLQEMGVKALIVIEQDSYMPTVFHQRADFSVSGNPTSDNIQLIQRIPAVVHVSHKDGTELKKMVNQGGMRAKIASIVETGWKTLPLLLADIKGSKDPEKFLLVNGHVDTPPFSPGVVDNASGDVALLELARILNNHKKKLGRTVRFAFWTGHEIGRYAGSTWFNDAFWHDLRCNCIGSLNIDSPGSQGASTFRAAPISEAQEVAVDSIKQVTGIKVEDFRWPTRAGDGSFWGTGFTHASVTSSRPRDLYDPYVNYSGGGWWWHTPYATMEHGDIDVLITDVKVELNFILRMINCPVLPLNFVAYSKHMLKTLEGLQEKASKIRSYFNLYPILEQADEFRKHSEALENTIKLAIEQSASKDVLQDLNSCLLRVSRYINPVAHSDAGPTEQMSMDAFGSIPFPRIHEIVKLADMTSHQSPEFKFLSTKLIRQRNAVEDGFYQANETIKETLLKVEKKLQ